MSNFRIKRLKSKVRLLKPDGSFKTIRCTPHTADSSGIEKTEHPDCDRVTASRPTNTVGNTGDTSERYSSEISIDSKSNNSHDVTSTTTGNREQGFRFFHIDPQSNEIFESSDQMPISGGKVQYSERKRRLAEAWKDLTPKLIDIATLMHAPTSFVCTVCKQRDDSIIRCPDCGPQSFFCSDCFGSFHSVASLHVSYKWKEKIFVNYSLPVVWKRSDGHSCSSVYLKHLSILDDKGRQHGAKIEFCQCETEAETLLRFNLWPASPTSPQIAFSTQLLEWLRVLCMECQVSVRGFCNVLKMKFHQQNFPFGEQEIRSVYHALISETFEEYRSFSFKMRYLRHLCSKLSDGTECPACPRDVNELKIFSMDANFGLVRKKSSGLAASSPKHDGRFFLDQKKVDEFVSVYSDERKDGGGECNSFKAGDLLRSKSRSEKLDETAIFGAACRHEFPKLFFSLKFGERLAYPVNLLENILSQHKGNILMLYDIACVLTSHLKKKGRNDILDKVKLALPIFHSFGHKMTCQYLYGPRRINGIGLTDGEVMERIWSYMRKFSCITKEMTPEHRTDVLTDALLFYGDKVIKNMGRLLVTKMERALAVKSQAEVTLKEITSTSTETITPILVKTWFNMEQDQAKGSVSNSAEKENSWKYQYALLLHQFFQLKKALSSVSDMDFDHISECTTSLPRLESQLISIEKKNHIQERWSENSEIYKESAPAASDTARKNILTELRQKANEQSYLVTLMRKYARGQSIANKLQRQLKKNSDSVKKLLKDYNSLHASSAEQMPITIRLEDITSANFSLWAYSTNESFTVEVVEDRIPPSVKRQVVDTACMLARASEEIELLKKEMLNCIKWHECQRNIILQRVYNLQNLPASNFSTGAIALMLHSCIEKEKLIQELCVICKKFVDVPEVNLHFVESETDEVFPGLSREDFENIFSEINTFENGISDDETDDPLS